MMILSLESMTNSERLTECCFNTGIVDANLMLRLITNLFMRLNSYLLNTRGSEH